MMNLFKWFYSQFLFSWNIVLNLLKICRRICMQVRKTRLKCRHACITFILKVRSKLCPLLSMKPVTYYANRRNQRVLIETVQQENVKCNENQLVTELAEMVSFQRYCLLRVCLCLLQPVNSKKVCHIVFFSIPLIWWVCNGWCLTD